MCINLSFYPATRVEIQPGGGRATVSGGILKAVFIRLKMSHSAMRYGIVRGSEQQYALWYYCKVILCKCKPYIQRSC